jgi:hypothetical protein
MVFAPPLPSRTRLEELATAASLIISDGHRPPRKIAVKRTGTVVAIGLTSTRHGLAIPQRRSLRGYLWLHGFNGMAVLHHGMCEGGDHECNDDARLMGIRTIGHPPLNEQLLAKMIVDECREPARYLVRNGHVVAESQFLVACPHGYIEQWAGSGTWAALREAERRGKKVIFIWPDGIVTDRRRV